MAPLTSIEPANFVDTHTAKEMLGSHYHDWMETRAIRARELLFKLDTFERLYHSKFMPGHFWLLFWRGSLAAFRATCT